MHLICPFFEFGPISVCPTFSRCWFGMVSCGQMNQSLFLQEYRYDLEHYPSRDLLDESPHLPLRNLPPFLGWSMQSLTIQFRIIGPETLFPEVVYVPGRNILLCFYTLTIPGSYRIDIIPREFYPGVLFKYTKHEKKVGYDLLGYKSFFWGEIPQVPSFPMKSSPVFCDPMTRQRTKASPFTVPITCRLETTTGKLLTQMSFE
jgi:hypothetical protein